MAKKVYVASVQPDPEGPVFGRVIDPTDIQKLQDYAHGHVDQIVKDLLVAGAPGAQVAGFAAAVSGGLNVEVEAGSAVDALGISYGGAATEVAMQAAHVALPRIDLIYATLAVDTAAGSEFRPFRQLRTQLELEAGTEYFPVQYNQPTELHTGATIGVKTGVPGAEPVAPAAGDGEVPLWQVHVAAGQAVLDNEDLTDVRVLMRSLYQAFVDIAAIAAQFVVLPETVQDIVGAFLAGSTSITATYDDAGNAESFALHTTYKTPLDNATNAATASTLMKRDASADVAVRDIKPTRQVLFSDSSVLLTPRYAEQQIVIFDLETYFSTETGPAPGTMATVTGSTGWEFYLNLKAEDFVNVPLVFEVAARAIDHRAIAQLYNVTDAAVLASCEVAYSEIVTQVLSDADVGRARSPIFFLTGSGRKRLEVRLGRVFDGGNPDPAYEVRIFSARIIAYPAYSQCGGWGQSGCST